MDLLTYLFPSVILYRIWDIAGGCEAKKIDFPKNPTSLELSSDGSVLVVTYGNFTSFWNAQT